MVWCSRRGSTAAVAPMVVADRVDGNAGLLGSVREREGRDRGGGELLGAHRDGQLASTACEPRVAQTSCGAWCRADGQLMPRRDVRPVGHAESPTDARPTMERPRSIR
jgi:hypothetical protein